MCGLEHKQKQSPSSQLNMLTKIEKRLRYLGAQRPGNDSKSQLTIHDVLKQAVFVFMYEAMKWGDLLAGESEQGQALIAAYLSLLDHPIKVRFPNWSTHH